MLCTTCNKEKTTGRCETYNCPNDKDPVFFHSKANKAEIKKRYAAELAAEKKATKPAKVKKPAAPKKPARAHAANAWCARRTFTAMRLNNTKSRTTHATRRSAGSLPTGAVRRAGHPTKKPRAVRLNSLSCFPPK